MILLCDEDVGTGVPKALSLVGYRASALVELGLGGRPDVQWLTIAGRRGWLVLSCNKKMLVVQSERETIIRERVGIVYLTTGWEQPAQVLKLLLNKWDKLELFDNTTSRPFARFLNPRGALLDKYRQYRL